MALGLAHLLLAHLLADFPLQTISIFELKQTGNAGIFVHALIHALTTALLIKNLNSGIGMLAAILVIHYLIDLNPNRFPFFSPIKSFIADQFLHLFALFVIAFFARNLAWELKFQQLLPFLLAAFVPAIFMGVFIHNQSKLECWTEPPIFGVNYKFCSWSSGIVIVVALIFTLS